MNFVWIWKTCKKTGIDFTVFKKSTNGMGGREKGKEMLSIKWTPYSK